TRPADDRQWDVRRAGAKIEDHRFPVGRDVAEEGGQLVEDGGHAAGQAIDPADVAKIGAQLIVRPVRAVHQLREIEPRKRSPRSGRHNLSYEPRYTFGQWRDWRFHDGSSTTEMLSVIAVRNREMEPNRTPLREGFER